MLARLLAHPLTHGLSVDDPRTTLLRRQIIRTKPFLRQLYSEWYRRIVTALAGRRAVLELGSGAGFFKAFCPDAIASEVFFTPGIDVVADACALPFPAVALDAIVMTDVFHHIPDVASFLHEGARCLRPGGRMIMIEPWRTSWAQMVYTHLHSEPFLPDGPWEIPATGPLSGANGALPWIVFERDRELFAERFPRWRLVAITPMMPVAYLLSGGVSMRGFMPGWMYRPIRAFEGMFGERHCAMFAMIELELRGDGAGARGRAGIGRHGGVDPRAKRRATSATAHTESATVTGMR